MFENLKKAFEKGVDLAFSTEAKIEKAAKDFAAENNLNKAEAKKLLDQWLKKSGEAKKAMEKQIMEMQKAMIAKMNLATKQEIKKLEDRIKKLEGTGKKPVVPKKKVVPVKKVVKKPVIKKKK
jgi:polyhydroxyalkanoate synthesis regulator phasin